jgi:hypothetical protein
VISQAEVRYRLRRRLVAAVVDKNRRQRDEESCEVLEANPTDMIVAAWRRPR